MNRELLIEAREALVILLTLYEDITSKEVSLPFISDTRKFKDFTKNYDLDYVYKIYEKIKK